MRQLAHPLSRLHLGELTAAAFMKQQRDHRGLYENDRAGQHDLPAVLLPGCRYAKVDLAAGWKQALTDLPASQFAPVVARRPTLLGGVLMSPGFSPPRMRTATAATRLAPASGECMGPPIISSP